MTDYQEQLILKLLNGTISLEERRILNAWINESAANKKLVYDFMRIWKSDKDRSVAPDFQTEDEWRKLEAILPKDENKLHSPGYAFKIAASIALVGLFSWLLYHAFFSYETILKESQNSIVMVALPDGSEVWLNQHSRLTYQDDFNDKNRNVQLEGEAFFQVRKDTQRPFIIQTHQAKVKVLGTSFNVQAYEETNGTEVYVATGLVSISTIENKTNGITLKPGETGTLTNGDIKVHREEDFNALAWKEKRLIFKKTSLNTVVESLEEYFKIHIKIRKASILQCRFTGSFDQPTLEEIIEALSVTLDLTIAKENDAYVIDGDGC